MKISIITVCYNSQDTIAFTLNSILNQDYKNIEHIIVDGGSTDNTINIINQYNFKNKIFISEKDKGIYDAMNKGIARSTGEFVTTLNADDIYQNNSTISDVVKLIKESPNEKIFIGNIIFFKHNIFNDIVRIYDAKFFKKWMLNIGVMPPHPSTFIKKEIYKIYNYNINFKIAADFEFFLKLFKINNYNFKYLDLTIVRMRTGGISGKNILSYLISTIEIYKAFKEHKLKKNYLTILARIPFKLNQFITYFKKKKINSNFKFTISNFLSDQNTSNELRLVKDFNNLINSNSNFVLSGLNLAFLGYYSKNDINIYKNLYVWPDGLFSRTIGNIKKLPGRILFNNIQLNSNIINKIIVIGNLSEKNKNYVKSKFYTNLEHINLPYGDIKYICKFLPEKLDDNSLILITLPTPKQEQIAKFLISKLQNYKIICIGASISLASGEEKPIPKYLENLGIEFLWRIKSDTKRRIKRLVETFYYYLKGKINNKYKKLYLKEID
jgi:glycosyltransferase involved in cell wall biosynthesis